MDNLFWARSQMAFSLGFHIVFASISMVIPFYMALAHHRYLQRRDPEHLRLTKAWSKGAAVLFATGAVSGTALSSSEKLFFLDNYSSSEFIIGKYSSRQ